MKKTGRRISIETIEGKGTHAIYKAREDVNTIAREMGYRPLVLGSTSRIGFLRVLRRYYDIFSLKFRLRKDDTVFFQFPWIHNNKPQFYDNLYGSNAQIQCIIHDLDSLRGIERKDNNELNDLSRCNHIIAHTPAMKKFLVEKGIAAEKIEILNFFPYKTTVPLAEVDNGDCPTVIFAGNLTKSSFVNELKDIACDKLRFNLYGNGAESFNASTYVCYKGVFAPDYPDGLTGNWGLVWDGSSLDTCNGLYGEYLRYNSSHKASLYLTLGIPLVLWSQSSLKDFVLSHKLGIAVVSLRDLPSALASLTQEDVTAIRRNVKDYSKIIRNGKTLKDLIK